MLVVHIVVDNIKIVVKCCVEFVEIVVYGFGRVVVNPFEVVVVRKPNANYPVKCKY